MNDALQSAAGSRPVATSSPGGGVALQYRVQYLETRDSSWRHYASCTRTEQAESCVSQLRQRGYEARLICYRICPVAA